MKREEAVVYLSGDGLRRHEIKEKPLFSKCRNVGREDAARIGTEIVRLVDSDEKVFNH